MENISTEGVADRKHYIDRMKGIAIIGVMAIHSLVNSVALPISKSLSMIMGIGIYGPYLFFIISGLGAMASWNRANHSYINFIKKRWIKLAPMYIFMILFWLIFNKILMVTKVMGIAFNQNTHTGSIILNALLLHGIFTNSMNTVVPGGWYIGVLFLMYMSFPLFWAIVNWTSKLFINKMFGSIIIVYLFYALGILILDSKFYMLISPIFDFKPFIRAIPSFLLGMFLYNGENGILYITVSRGKKISWMLVTLVVAVLAGTMMYKGYKVDFIFMVFHICLYSLFEMLENSSIKFKCLEYLGKNSYYIYLIHALPFWYGWEKISYYFTEIHPDITYIIYFVFAFITTSVLAVVMNFIDNKLMKLVLRESKKILNK